MKDLFSALKGRRKKRFWFFFITTVVLWLIPILLRPLVERTNEVNQIIALVFVVLTALVVAYLAGQRGKPVSADTIPLNTPLLVLWKGEFKDPTGTTYRRALIQDPEGDQHLFEFVGDMSSLWKTFEEGQVIKFEEKFVQNDYDHDQDRYDLVVRIL